MSEGYGVEGSGTSTLCMTILAFVVLQVGHSILPYFFWPSRREASTESKLLGDRLPVVEGVLVDDEAAIGKLAVVIQGHEQVTDKRRLLGVGRIEQDEQQADGTRAWRSAASKTSPAMTATRAFQTERGEVLLEDGTGRAIALDERCSSRRRARVPDAKRPTTREGVEHDDVGQVWQT